MQRGSFIVGSLVTLVVELLWVSFAAAAVVPGAPDYPTNPWTQINVARVDTSYLVPGKNTLETFKPEAGTGDGQAFYFFVKGGTVNKLVVFYLGGGACWDFRTCGGDPLVEPASCTTNLVTLDTVNSHPRLKDLLDPPPGTTYFSVMDGKEKTFPTSPFHDWYKVFVPYATCDAHTGNNTVTYTSGTQQLRVYHKGMANSLSVLNWVDENFGNPDPEQLVIAGGSAGGIGAIASAPYFLELFPNSQALVLGDASITRLTPFFEQVVLPNWKLDLMWPAFIPSLASGPTLIYNDTIQGIAGLWEKIVPYYFGQEDFPTEDLKRKFFEYTDSDDSTQESFNFRVHRLDPTDKITPEAASADWKSDMLSYTDAMWPKNPNYRYYIAPGTGHVILNNNPKIFSLEVANLLEDGKETAFIDFLIGELSSDAMEVASSVKPSVDHRVFEIRPGTVPVGFQEDVTIIGENFVPGATVKFTPFGSQVNPPPTVSNVAWEDSETITATVTANIVGIWNVVVTQVSAEAATLHDATLPGGFVVDDGTDELTSLWPTTTPTAALPTPLAPAAW